MVGKKVQIREEERGELSARNRKFNFPNKGKETEILNQRGRGKMTRLEEKRRMPPF